MPSSLLPFSPALLPVVVVPEPVAAARFACASCGNLPGFSGFLPAPAGSALPGVCLCCGALVPLGFVDEVAPF